MLMGPVMLARRKLRRKKSPRRRRRNRQGAQNPQAVPRKGIKAHGHWTIDVRNPDGTLASHHEFENALDGLGGRAALAFQLSGTGTAGTWASAVNNRVGGGPCDKRRFCIPLCYHHRGTAAPFLFPNLVVTVVGLGFPLRCNRQAPQLLPQRNTFTIDVNLDGHHDVHHFPFGCVRRSAGRDGSGDRARTRDILAGPAVPRLHSMGTSAYDWFSFGLADKEWRELSIFW